MALKTLLGLVCDPVGVFVEVPCVKRNVIGAVNALSAADMALAGIESRISPDQVIDAMRQVGEQMHLQCLYETDRRSPDRRGLRSSACGAGELSERVEGIR